MRPLWGFGRIACCAEFLFGNSLFADDLLQ